MYLEGAYRGQVNGKIQDTYNDIARYEELADPKYTDLGGIFDHHGDHRHPDPSDGGVTR